MVPIIGLDNSGYEQLNDDEWQESTLRGEGTFTTTQPQQLVKAIAGELGIADCMCSPTLFFA